MKFTSTPIKGAYIVELEKKIDERGFFARAFCVDEFAKQGLTNTFAQINMSGNNKKGTIRGLHYQTKPYQEAKFKRCISGKVFDVIVDMRKDSETYLKWFGAELSEENKLGLYVPEGCANGYQALSDNAVALYMTSSPFEPTAEKGVRWDDPKINVAWPIMHDVIVSDKDKSHPNI